jgi:hypothetical protein
MRILGTALLVFTAWSACAQPASSSGALPGKLWIPAQLAHTVRADKAHPGDRVQFKTIEAVLVGNGLVMPANTALIGRVLAAAPKRNNSNSYLAVVVERAEWKDHSLPLHAFVAAQITVKPKNAPPAGADATTDAASGRRGRVSARAAGSDPDLSGAIRAPHDSVEAAPPEAGPKYPALGNVGLYRDKDGTAYLISSKANLKLPAGVPLMLENQPVGSSNALAGRTAGSTAAAVQP